MKHDVSPSILQRPILLGSLAFGILGFVLPIYGKQLGASALEIGGLFSAFSIMTVLLRPLVLCCALQTVKPLWHPRISRMNGKRSRCLRTSLG